MPIVWHTGWRRPPRSGRLTDFCAGRRSPRSSFGLVTCLAFPPGLGSLRGLRPPVGFRAAGPPLLPPWFSWALGPALAPGSGPRSRGPRALGPASPLSLWPWSPWASPGSRCPVRGSSAGARGLGLVPAWWRWPLARLCASLRAAVLARPAGIVPSGTCALASGGSGGPRLPACPCLAVSLCSLLRLLWLPLPSPPLSPSLSPRFSLLRSATPLRFPTWSDLCGSLPVVAQWLNWRHLAHL